MDYFSELPDCVLSYILSMLSMKDLVKTSILSKRWYKLWSLRRDLNFDVHSVLGSEEELREAGYLVDQSFNWDLSRVEFVKRVDQFIKNFQDRKVDSLLVDFFLNSEQSSIIDQWMSFALARGVERIDLCFLGSPYEPPNGIFHYNFPFHLFSKSNNSILNHLSLQYCLVCHPPNNFDFLPFTNLRSLELEESQVDEVLITRLLSICLLLEELSLIHCELKSPMLKITSSSLYHLKVKNCFVSLGNGIRTFPINLRGLDCPKLTSLDCEGCHLEGLSIYTPKLKSIYHFVVLSGMPNALALFSTLPQLETLNLYVDAYTHIQENTLLNLGTGPLKHLKQLNLSLSGDAWSNTSWILTILQACPVLQKLSIMVLYPKFYANQKHIRDLEMFSHNEVKIIEMGGCVGNWYEIELVVNVLKYFKKLERIVLSPYWRHSDSCDWKSDSTWFENGRERIREEIHGKEIGRAKLILL